MEPTLFINVFRHWQTVSVKNTEGALVKKPVTVDISYEHAVCTTRLAAVKHAEEHADYYVYTLTDAGRIDLTGDFSEEYHEDYQDRRDFDAAVDARIDELKEEARAS